MMSCPSQLSTRGIDRGSRGPPRLAILPDRMQLGSRAVASRGRRLLAGAMLVAVLGGWFVSSGALLAAAEPPPALACRQCGRDGIAALTMLCPRCGSELRSLAAEVEAGRNAALAIELFYTGDELKRLPAKGVVRLNRRPIGEIVLEDQEPRDPNARRFTLGGLGVDYTARYRFAASGLTAGQVGLEIELVFPRLRGLAASRRVLRFAHVPLVSGQTTRLRYGFAAGKDFGLRPRPDLAVALATGAPPLPPPATPSRPLLPPLPIDLQPVEGGAQITLPGPDL